MKTPPQVLSVDSMLQSCPCCGLPHRGLHLASRACPVYTGVPLPELHPANHPQKYLGVQTCFHRTGKRVKSGPRKPTDKHGLVCSWRRDLHPDLIAADVSVKGLPIADTVVYSGSEETYQHFSWSVCRLETAPWRSTLLETSRSGNTQRNSGPKRRWLGRQFLCSQKSAALPRLANTQDRESELCWVLRLLQLVFNDSSKAKEG